LVKGGLIIRGTERKRRGIRREGGEEKKGAEGTGPYAISWI